MSVIRVFPALLLLALPACGDDGGTTPSGPGQVAVRDDFFAPQTVNPATDGVVTWTWAGGRGHNVTFEDGLASSSTKTSGTHERDFTGATAGTYRYRCTIHSSDFTSGMRGSVVVP